MQRLLLVDIASSNALSWISEIERFQNVKTIQEFYEILFQMDRSKIHDSIEDTEHCIFCGFFDVLLTWKTQKDPQFPEWYNYAVKLIHRRNKFFPFKTYYNELVNEIQDDIDRQEFDVFKEKFRQISREDLEKISSLSLDDMVVDFADVHLPSRTFTQITDKYGLDTQWYSANAIHEMANGLLD